MGLPARAAANAAEMVGPATPPEVRALRDLVLKRLDDEQAQDVVAINLSGKTDVADFMVIASGRAPRHVGAIADKLARDLKDAGLGTVAVEGMPACDWVLIDAGDVIVHVFRPEVRGFYNLERIWAPELYEARPPTPPAYVPAIDEVGVTDVATDRDPLDAAD